MGNILFRFSILAVNFVKCSLNVSVLSSVITRYFGNLLWANCWPSKTTLRSFPANLFSRWKQYILLGLSIAIIFVHIILSWDLPLFRISEKNMATTFARTPCNALRILGEYYQNRDTSFKNGKAYSVFRPYRDVLRAFNTFLTLVVCSRSYCCICWVRIDSRRLALGLLVPPSLRSRVHASQLDVLKFMDRTIFLASRFWGCLFVPDFRSPGRGVHWHQSIRNFILFDIPWGYAS